MTTFGGAKYATRGIANEINIFLQIILWDLIEQKKQRHEPLDYLQIFELSTTAIRGYDRQKIIHRQEQPPFSRTHYYDIPETYQGKIWVIDSGEYVTMLFPHEY